MNHVMILMDLWSYMFAGGASLVRSKKNTLSESRVMIPPVPIHSSTYDEGELWEVQGETFPCGPCVQLIIALPKTWVNKKNK